MTIRYVISLRGPAAVRADYAIRLLFEGIGVAARRVDAVTDADLVYATEQPPGLADHALWVAASGDGDWDATTPELVPPDALDRGRATVDVVRATYAVVTGGWERGHPRNAWGVPLCRRRGERIPGPWERPLVAMYCEALASMLAQARRSPLDRVPRWPDGKTYAVVLSHDVDAPFIRAPWSFYGRRLAGNLARRDLRAATHGVLQAAKTAKTTRFARLTDAANDPNFRFDEWLDLVQAVPTRSCFYVAVTTSADPLGAPVDVNYDFRRPELVSALRRAIDGGCEVGLHASANARRHPGRIGEERELLESVLDGYAVSGVRHHYWALDPDVPERTLWEHARGNLAYDSSFGLNDAPGFRRGMAWPFQPFDRECAQEVPILEVPPTLMDGAIFYQRVTPAEGRRLIDEHVREVKRHGGAAVLDWHPEQLNPARLHGAGSALRAALVELAADGDAHWASPSELAEWWRARRRLIEASA